jgi:uncharacterized phage-associated protein
MANANAYDVAAYILNRTGGTSHMKLQKLVYYSQAWSLVWEDKPLFSDKIEAWANGPVVPSLYQQLKGQFLVLPEHLKFGQANNLSDQEKETVNRVIDFYGKHNAQWISDLTHQERPWLDAREGLPLGARSETEITLASMAEYYGSL